VAPDPTTRRWHAAITRDAEAALGRRLSPTERAFITARTGGLALEMIQDEVRRLAADPAALARYLRAETDPPPAPPA